VEARSAWLIRAAALIIRAKAVKPYLTFAIVIFAASPACAQADPAGPEQAYLHCLLAHALDERSGDEEKSILIMVLDKCAQEFHCAATGTTNCADAAGTIAHFAFRSTRG
jgi:hypothetical protein